MSLSLSSRRLLRLSPGARTSTLRQYSSSTQQSPSARTRSKWPYVVGVLAVGTGGLGIASYAWYYFSGAKRVVDTAVAGKQKYDETKASIAEKREQIAAISAAAKERTANVTDRLKRRYGASKAAKEDDTDSEDGGATK